MPAGVVMAKRATDGALIVDGHEEEIAVLFTAAYGRAVPPRLIAYIRRAAELMAKISDAKLCNASR